MEIYNEAIKVQEELAKNSSENKIEIQKELVELIKKVIKRMIITEDSEEIYRLSAVMEKLTVCFDKISLFV